MNLSPQSYTGPDGSRAGVRRPPQPEKVRILATIAEVCVADGAASRLGAPLVTVVYAAWANAYGESGLDPTAWRQEPDGRTSYGLFQCLQGATQRDGSWKRGGAGDGHAVPSLLDPAYNTRVILQEAYRAAAKVRMPADVPAAVEWWVRYVERPADVAGATARRVSWLRSWGAA